MLQRLETVSYTHLDVYKRQAWVMTKRNAARFRVLKCGFFEILKIIHSKIE